MLIYSSFLQLYMLQVQSVSLFRQSNLKTNICPLVDLVNNLRNFKIEYLILKRLRLKGLKK